LNIARVNSRRYPLGRKLTQGQTHELTGDGVHTLQMIHAYRLIDIRCYPPPDLIICLLTKLSTAQTQMLYFLNRLRAEKENEKIIL
jgi:hypothetical protein